MVVGGTKMYCPSCRTETVCRAISPSKLEKAKDQRVSHEQYDDLHWFRRGRECLNCSTKFLTGELNEQFITELTDLRRAWLKKIKPQATKARRNCSKRSREETVSLELAQDFIKKSAYWDHPTAYEYVSAPRHADNIYKHSLGWAVDFGANTFLPGMAISRGMHVVADIFQELENGVVRFREVAIDRLMHTISGCVATQNGDEYNGYYPMEDEYLRFGTQLIDTEYGALFILSMADPKQILMSRSAG